MKKLFLVCLCSASFSLLTFQAQAQINTSPTLVKKINAQSFENFEDSIATILVNSRSNPNERSKDEKYLERWMSQARKYIGYPGVQEGGDLNWKKQYTGPIFSCNNTGPTNAVWQPIGPKPEGKIQSIGLVMAVAPATQSSLNVLYLGSEQGGFWKSTNGGQVWENKTDYLNIPTLGISSITVNPNNPNHIVFSTMFGESGYTYPTDNRIMVSFDGGETWSTSAFVDPSGNPMNVVSGLSINNDYDIHENTFIEEVKFHPTQPNLIYACGEESIYKSIDGGQTWTHSYTSSFNTGIEYIDIEMFPNDINHVFISSKWNGALDDDLPNQSSSGARMISTSDGGNSWFEVTPPNQVFYIGGYADRASKGLAMDVTPADPNVIYSSFADGEESSANLYIYKSSDFGQNWVLVNQEVVNNAFNSYQGHFGYWKHEFEVSNNSTDVFYIGCNTVLKKILPGGTWVQKSQYHPAPPSISSTHADIRCFFQLEMNTGNDVILMANDGGVASTENSANTQTSWINRNGEGLQLTQVVGLSKKPDLELVNLGGIHVGAKYIDESNSLFWDDFDRGDGEWVECLASRNRIYFGINGSFLRTTHNYTSPEVIDNLHTGTAKLGLKFYVDESDENYIWYGKRGTTSNNSAVLSHDLKIHNVDDNTEATVFDIPEYVTFDNQTVQYEVNPISALAVAPSDGDIILFSTLYPTWNAKPKKLKLMRSLDRGVTFEDLSTNFPYEWTYISDIIIDPENPSRMWASCAGVGFDPNTNAPLNRVLYSNNMGDSWQDISQGLGIYPVNDLEYYKGSNDLIFAATDAGVFYFNQNDNTWHCFNNELPESVVRRVEISYCDNYLYAGTYGRGVWKAPIVFDDPTILADLKQEINTSTTWNTDKFVPTDLLVKSGNTLTFAPDTRILMGNQKKIIVEPGAQLHVNGATITNGCSNPWKGIEVLGNSTLEQTTANQGKLSTLNNALIENAVSAISTIGRQGNLVDWNSTGGILELRNTIFKNNWRSIEFMSYHNYNGTGGEDFNVSLISKCSFDWDNDYISNYLNTPKEHVSLWDVRGVTFEGNTFNNNFSSAVNNLNNLQGIYSLGAWYKLNSTVGGLSNPPVRNTFNDLNVAVHHGSANGYDRVDISDAVFNNNHIGVYSEGASYSEIRTSEFNIREGQGFGEASHGIRIEGSSAHLIHENDFVHSGISGFNGNTGVYVLSADPLGTTNEIYKNSFTDLTSGIEISHWNSFGGNEYLQLDCDNFNDNGTYFSNYSSIFLANGEISDQGDCQSTDPLLAVANVFSGVYGINKSQFLEPANNSTIEYSSFPPNSVGIDQSPGIWPSNITINNCFTGPNAPPVPPPLNTMCPSYIPLITDPIMNPIPTWMSQIDEIEDIEENLSSGLITIDDENNLIATLLGSGNEHSKEQALLEKAPYLTSKVLNELAISNMANYRKNNILSLHYPVDQEVMYNMVNSPITITPYILRDALVAGAPVDKKTLLDFFSNEAIPNWAINDVGVANSPLSDDELIAILNRNNTLEPYRIWNILQLNTPLSDEVEIALMTLDPPTAQWVINKVNSSIYVAPDPSSRKRKTRSPLETLNLELFYFRKERFAIVNKIVRKYLDSNEVDSAIYVLEDQNSVNASCALVPIMLAEKQTKLNTHLQLIKDYVASLGEDEHEKANDLLKFCEYFEFVAPLHFRPGGYLNLSQDEIDIFRSYAESNISVSAMARSVLRYNGIEVFYHHVEPLPFQEGPPKKSVTIENGSNEDAVNIMLYPNPNNGNFIIEGKLQSNQYSGELVITDMSGKVIHYEILSGNEFREVITLKSIAGMYLYSIISNSVIIHRGKIIIN